MTQAETDKWFPVARVWPAVCDGRTWRGACASPLQSLRILPSVEHPGFFDYEITDISSGIVSSTKRPIAGHALCSFLESEGVRPEAFAWQAAEAANA